MDPRVGHRVRRKHCCYRKLDEIRAPRLDSQAVCVHGVVPAAHPVVVERLHQQRPPVHRKHIGGGNKGHGYALRPAGYPPRLICSVGHDDPSSGPVERACGVLQPSWSAVLQLPRHRPVWEAHRRCNQRFLANVVPRADTRDTLAYVARAPAVGVLAFGRSAQGTASRSRRRHRWQQVGRIRRGRLSVQRGRLCRSYRWSCRRSYRWRLRRQHTGPLCGSQRRRTRR